MPPSTSFELRLPSRLPRIPYQFARMPNLRRRVRDDRGRPLDGVDLRHQRRRDQARLLEELVVRPVAMLGGQPVGDRVVLAREERVQEREPEPEVAGDAGEVELRVEVARQLAVRVEPEPAARAFAERARDRRLAAVDLRSVPPVRVGGHEGRRRRRSRPGTGRCACARSASAARAHGSSSASSSSNGSSGRFLPWLNQSCTSNWSHAPARTFTIVAGLNSSRVSSLRLTRRGFGSSSARQLLGIRALERDVAAEAGADHPHRRLPEVVVAAVDRPRVVRAAVGAGLRAAGARVVEVLLAQPCAETGEREDAERQRQPVPAEAPVERGRRRGQQLRQPGSQASSFASASPQASRDGKRPDR